MANAHLRLAFASETANGNHVSFREAPFSTNTRGTSRFPALLDAHGPETGP
jgi:hypothetical protein